MSGLDPQYMLAPSLEQYFVDKDTGLPLNGTVTFYKDTARTTPKDVYILSGSPPNYGHTNIGNIVDIANGVLVYNNTNIQIYYLPFESTAPNADVELYYAVVESSDGVLQFTREGWPNFTQATTTEEDASTFIPNGQFLSHIDLAATDTLKAGEIRAPITNVAYGGWTFERPSSSSATDIVTFKSNGGYITNPTSNPRYNINVICENPGAGDSFKDLRVKFDDVNKFASTTTQYTYYFEGKANSGTSTVSIVLIKNFGTGGSSQTETTLHSYSLTGSFGAYSFAFNFGDNANKTIGLLNDDYVQLAFRFATDNQFDIEITNVALVQNAVNVVVFPIVTTSQNQYRSIAGFMPIPAYDGSDLYLPFKLSPSGITFDDSEVGDIISESQISVYVNSLHPTSNRMLADGAQYETNDYSPLGIPYARLQAKYFNTTLNIPMWGTGSNYFTALVNSANTSQIIISNNSPGAVTTATDVSTGFTIATIHTGSTGYFVKSYLISSAVFYIENINATAVTSVAAGTSGFSVATVQDGTLFVPQISQVDPTAATGLGGKYFTFNSWNSADIGYYVWFKVDGTGTDPAVSGRTGIEVDLNGTDTASVVAEKIRESLNGWQVTTVNTVAASSITGGSYFTINSVIQGYYAWYKVGTSGADPHVSGRLGIEVDIEESDTADQVATKTQIAINKKYFAAPDLRDLFIRGLGNGFGENRYSMVPGILGDVIGSFQLDDNKSHFHIQQTVNLSGSGGSGVAGGAYSTTDTNPAGGFESRPKNAYLNFVVKY